MTKRHRNYVVEEANRLNASVLDVALRPQGKRMAQRAGQFAFLRFPANRPLSEEHPFTISSAPGDELVRFSIKATGDWTKYLYQTLAVGDSARVDGSYGGFSCRKGRARQIWVAGGIGVTPFLSWIRDFDEALEPFDIDFFYTVRARPEAVFWREVRLAARRRPWFRASLNVSSEDGQLSAEQIASALGGDVEHCSVYLCGPVPMTEAFRSGLKRRGVAARNIHSEEFSFR